MCLLPYFAFGAALVPKGSMPEVQPLQPKPQGTFPNYEHNINSPPDDPNVQAPRAEDAANPNAQKEGGAPQNQAPGGNPFLIWGVVGLTVVFSLLAIALKKGGEDKK